MKTLYLPLKKEWYEMIERGIKTEEYREIKPFWEKRLLDYGRLVEYVANNRDEIIVRRMLNLPMRAVCERFPRNWDAVCFSYGYTRRRMTFECKGITIGQGARNGVHRITKHLSSNWEKDCENIPLQPYRDDLRYRVVRDTEAGPWNLDNLGGVRKRG